MGPRAVAAAFVLVLLAAAGAPAAAEERAGPLRAYVGVRLLGVRNLDVAAGLFDADFHLSVRWPASAGANLAELEVVNGSPGSREIVEEQEIGRWKRVVHRISGTFQAKFPLDDFPFDAQTLTLSFEHPRLAASELSLLPDVEGTSVAPDLDIPGWSFDRQFGAHAAVVSRGTSSFGPEGSSERSRLFFQIYLHRPLMSLLAKILVPLIVVFAMAHGAFWLHVREVDARVALITTSIFVCVGVHLVLADTLPDVDYLTAADIYFVAVYLFLLAEMVFMLWSHTLVIRERLQAAERLDRLVRWLLPPAALAVTVAASWPSARHETLTTATAAAVPRSARPELAIGLLHDPVAFGPLCESATEYFVTRLIEEPLVEQDPTGTPRAYMAAEVPTFENGRIRIQADGSAVVRWRLRPGARWGDGAAVGPADVVLEEPIVTFEDAKAVRFEDDEILVEYDAARPRVIYDAFLFPRHRLAGLDAEARRRVMTRELPPLGGPFDMASFQPGKEIRLVRNPHHVPLAGLERIVIRIFDRFEDLAAAFRKGAIQFIPSGEVPPAQALALAVEVKGARATLTDTPNVWHLDVNLDHPVLGDVRVRRALVHALDRDAMVRDVAGGHARVAHSWLPPGHQGAFAGIRRYEYDPARAEALLDEAGLKRGPDGKRRGPDGQPLSFILSRGDSHPKPLVEALQRYWGAVGIELVDEPIEYGHYMNVYTTEIRWKHFALWSYDLWPYDTGRTYWTEDSIPTAENGWRGFNYSRWREPRMLEIHERLDRTFNPDDLVERLAEQQSIWAEALPVITLYADQETMVAGPGLRGIRFNIGSSLLSWNAAEWRFSE